MHLCINVKQAIHLNNISKFGSYLTVDTKRLHYRHENLSMLFTEKRESINIAFW